MGLIDFIDDVKDVINDIKETVDDVRDEIKGIMEETIDSDEYEEDTEEKKNKKVVPLPVKILGWIAGVLVAILALIFVAAYAIQGAVFLL